MKQHLIALVAGLMATSAAAQDRLVETIIPDPRPYPYAVLDVQPGALATDAASMLA